MVDQLDFDLDEILYISAKVGTGLDKVFETIIDRIEPPLLKEKDIADTALKCFLFDARFVPNRGVACFVKVMSGKFDLEKVRQLMSFHMSKRYEVYEVGVPQPELTST